MDRVNVLEDEVRVLITENKELSAYVNTLVKEFNNVIDLLNARYNVD